MLRNRISQIIKNWEHFLEWRRWQSIKLVSFSSSEAPCLQDIQHHQNAQSCHIVTVVRRFITFGVNPGVIRGWFGVDSGSIPASPLPLMTQGKSMFFSNFGRWHCENFVFFKHCHGSVMVQSWLSHWSVMTKMHEKHKENSGFSRFATWRLHGGELRTELTPN